MKKFLMALPLVAAMVATPALADYTLVVPQNPGGGTSVWATIIGRELEKTLGEKVVIQHIPGAKDIPGANKFAEELYKDPKTIMVAHGGNAESFLYDAQAKYDYRSWSPIGLMNLDIITARRLDSDVYKEVTFAAGSGNNPDIMAITMMVCGPKPDVQAYLACYNEKVKYVPNISGGERRLAFMRGELNAQRETTAAFKKYVEPLIADGKVEIWFAHGVLDLKTGKVVEDPNFDGFSFAKRYKEKWGEEPKGDLYDAYLLSKNWRDVLQKSLWVGKDNPNADKLREAVRKMIANPESQKAIVEDAGEYEWFVGQDVTKAMDVLFSQTSAKSLRTLVDWTKTALKQDAVYKENLVRK